MRTILAMLLAACGSDGPSPHDVLPCGNQTYVGASTCERACANFQPDPNMTCTADLGGFTDTCSFTTFDGVKGCCLPQHGHAADVTFFECQ